MGIPAPDVAVRTPPPAASVAAQALVAYLNLVSYRQLGGILLYSGLFACGVAGTGPEDPHGETPAAPSSIAAAEGEPPPRPWLAASGRASLAATGTPGTIGCGSRTCQAGRERCCPEGGGSCEPIDHEIETNNIYCGAGNALTGSIRCDDRGDCPPGQACCWQSADSETDYALCSQTPCDICEACSGNGTCSKGLRCQLDPPRPGRCVQERPTARCGTTTCAGATPLCCWDPRARTASCVSDGDETCRLTGTPPGAALRCTSPRDCGTGRCCSFMATDCRGSCGNAQIVCETLVDCPASAAGASATACVGPAEPDGPPWIKTCRYGP